MHVMEEASDLAQATIQVDMGLVVLLIIALGCVAFFVIGIFAWKAFSHQVRDFMNFEKYLDFLDKKNVRTNIPRYLHESYAEYLLKRNEFWTSYGQVMVAVLIIIILAILLVTKTISAESGLPILSAVSGFAIAKGVGSSRGPSSPNDPSN